MKFVAAAIAQSATSIEPDELIVTLAEVSLLTSGKLKSSWFSKVQSVSCGCSSLQGPVCHWLAQIAEGQIESSMGPPSAGLPENFRSEKMEMHGPSQLRK